MKKTMQRDDATQLENTRDATANPPEILPVTVAETLAAFRVNAVNFPAVSMQDPIVPIFDGTRKSKLASD